MTIELHNELVEKCKNKKNGVWQYNGVLYVAKDGKFIGYSTLYYEIFKIVGGFRTSIGKFKSYEIRNKLKEIFLS